MTAGKKQSVEELLFDVELLTIQQVTKWTKVSTKSIYRWIEAGKTPVVKIGKRTYRIPARAVINQLRASGYELGVPEKKQSQ
jgi:excisionase family DNA binding protein